jgi:tetratricopeptide (TPR) repeat protein
VAKKKKIAKQLKRPDQFVDFWTRASHQLGVVLDRRRKPALAVLVALVVMVVGNAIWERWEGGRQMAASTALARIERVALAELAPAAGASPPGVDPNDPMADLQTSSGEDDIPKFKTAPERRDAVLRELDGFLATYGRSRLADEALLMKGAELVAAGRHDDAITAYRSALEKSRLAPDLRRLAQEGIAYAYEGKGDLTKALEAFGALGGDSAAQAGFYQDRALYQRARITERKGDSAGAVKLYREALEKVSESSLREQITDRLSLIEAK